MKRNENGFSAVEAVLLLIIVGLIGFVGWYVWQSKNKTNNSLQNTSSIQDETARSPQKNTEAETAKPVDETANWTKITSGKNSFAVKIPDGWNLQNWTSRDYIYAGSYKDVTYTAGKAATVTRGDTYALDSGAVRHFNITGNPIAQKNSIGYYFEETPQDFGLSSGVKGKKYVHTYTENVDGVKKGDKVYFYRFEGSKTLVTVDYYVLSGESDQSALVEKAIKTLSFE